MSDRFNELLDRYWAAAYVQGRAGLDADDKHGSAQAAESSLCHYVDSLRTALATAEAERDAAHDEALERAIDVAERHTEMCQSCAGVGNAIERLKKETPNADT